MSLPQSSSYPQGSSYHHPSDHFPLPDTRYFQYLAPSPTTSQSQATYHRAQPFSAPTGLENQPHVDYAVDATSVNGQELYPSHVYPEDAVQPSGVPAQWSYQDGQDYANYQSVQPGGRWMTEQQSQPFDHSYGAAQIFQAPSESSAQAAMLNQHQGFYTEPDNISPSSDHSGVRYSPSDYFPDQRNGFEDGRYSSGSSGSDSSRDSSDYHGHGSQSAPHFAHSGQTACAEPRRSRRHDLQSSVFYEHTNVGRDQNRSDCGPSQPTPASPMAHYGSQPHPFGHAHHHAYQHPRAPSPMAHLPYPEEMQRQMTGSSFAHSPTDNDPRWSEYRPEARTQLHQPQPHYPTPTPHSNEAQYNQRYTPGSIALPAPTRSPPLIEDTPKKPLSLACLFCRKRKIACGSPPPDRADRTCNQCARRSLKCEYPVASRRGMRPRNDGDGGDGLIQFSPMNQ